MEGAILNAYLHLNVEMRYPSRDGKQIYREDSPSVARCVYVLDEPMTGLYPSDVAKLMKQLDGLVDSGKAVFVIEHDMRVAAASDWIPDIGPGAGDEGGWIIAAESPAPLVARGNPVSGRSAVCIARHAASRSMESQRSRFYAVKAEREKARGRCKLQIQYDRR
jgi:hypothetical protein